MHAQCLADQRLLFPRASPQSEHGTCTPFCLDYLGSGYFYRVYDTATRALLGVMRALPGRLLDAEPIMPALFGFDGFIGASLRAVAEAAALARLSDDSGNAVTAGGSPKRLFVIA
jgi:hypothetical protein